MNKEVKRIRAIRGEVVGTSMTDTATVLVTRVKTHPIYKKKFTVSKKFKADDPGNSCKVGDMVEIVSTKPLSKDKHYKILRKI